LSLLVRAARIVDPASGLDAEGDLLIGDDGRLQALGLAAALGAAEVVEARGLIACPGLVDLHVHFREPGQEHKETIASGARAAAAGGFTTVVCETNTSPVIDNALLLQELRARAAGESVQVLFKHCLTVGQAGKQVADLQAARRAGAAAASDDGQPTLDGEVMHQGLAAARAAGLVVTPHCEESLASREADPWPVPYRREPALVKRDLALAGETGAALHLSHLSTAEAVRALAAARARGWAVSGEVTPHHLTLCAEQAGDHPDFKTNPPLRSRTDQEAMQQALAAGVVEVIASDHAPHTPEEKAQGWEQAPFGLIGLETALAVLLTGLVAAGRMRLEALLAALTWHPARVLGLQAGRLAVGERADLCLFDAGRRWRVDPANFASKGRNCPWAGQWLTGRVVMTVAGGRVAYQGG